MDLIFESSIRNALIPITSKWVHTEDNIFQNGVYYHKFVPYGKRSIRLGIDHIMLINMIHHGTYMAKWGNNPPTSINDSRVQEQQSMFNHSFMKEHYIDHLNNESTVKKLTGPLNYYSLKTMFPFFDDTKMTPTKTFLTLIDIHHSAFKLKLDIRWIDIIDYGNFKKSRPNIRTFCEPDLAPQQLFKLESDFIDKGIKGRGQAVRDFGLRLDMTTFYGHVVAQGIRFLNVDRIPDKIYTSKISENAKLIYVLLMCGWDPEFELTTAEIAKRLSLRRNDITKTNRSVDSYMNELSDNGFIEFKRLGKYRNVRYIGKRLIV